MSSWQCRGDPDGVLDDAVRHFKAAEVKSNNEWIEVILLLPIDFWIFFLFFFEKLRKRDDSFFI